MFHGLGILSLDGIRKIKSKIKNIDNSSSKSCFNFLFSA